MRIIHCVAAALVDKTGAVLLAQRPEGKSMAGLWEFPGGKVEQGEAEDVALARELQEELGIDVNPQNLQHLTSVEHQYPDFILQMALFGCKEWSGTPRGVEGQVLEWAAVDEMHLYAMPAADPPLIPYISDYV